MLVTARLRQKEMWSLHNNYVIQKRGRLGQNNYDDLRYLNPVALAVLIKHHGGISAANRSLEVG